MASFSELLRAFSRTLNLEEPGDLAGVGDITNPNDRQRAINVAKAGGTIQLIVGDEHASVGGIFFDIDNPNAVDHVVALKSVPDRPRTKLFGVMMPDEDLTECAKRTPPLRLEAIQKPCFIQVPVRDTLPFPEWAQSTDNDTVYVQCFPSDHVRHFGDLVREAQEERVRLGGTSLNLSESENITDLTEAAAFFYLSTGQRYWLETALALTGTSYTIIRLHEEMPQAELVRTGNVSLQEICEQLGVTPVKTRKE